MRGPAPVLLALLLPLSLGHVAPQAAGPGPGLVEDEHARPVFFVHGFDPPWPIGDDFLIGGNLDPSDTSSYFGKVVDEFRQRGWAGALVVQGYYVNDRLQSQDISDYPTAVIDPDVRHELAYGGTKGHQFGRHTRDADIRHLAWHWAWAAEEFTKASSQPCAKVVAHSMGGLIVRYALSMVGREVPEVNQTSPPATVGAFPKGLCITDVVTLSTPHLGTVLGDVCVTLVVTSKQCKQMATSSTFIEELRTRAQNPQSARPTDWTLIGSQGDRFRVRCPEPPGTCEYDLVSASSATGMLAAHALVYKAGNDTDVGAPNHEQILQWGWWADGWDRTAHVGYRDAGDVPDPVTGKLVRTEVSGNSRAELWPVAFAYYSTLYKFWGCGTHDRAEPPGIWSRRVVPSQEYAWEPRPNEDCYYDIDYETPRPEVKYLLKGQAAPLDPGTAVLPTLYCKVDHPPTTFSYDDTGQGLCKVVDSFYYVFYVLVDNHGPVTGPYTIALSKSSLRQSTCLLDMVCLPVCVAGGVCLPP